MEGLTMLPSGPGSRLASSWADLIISGRLRCFEVFAASLSGLSALARLAGEALERGGDALPARLGQRDAPCCTHSQHEVAKA